MQFFATCIWYRWRECEYQHCQYDAERGLRGAYEAGPLVSCQATKVLSLQKNHA